MSKNNQDILGILDKLESLGEDEWDWTIPKIKVTRGKHGSVMSVHVGKHVEGAVEAIATQLTKRLQRGQHLTRENIRKIFKKFSDDTFWAMQPGELLGLFKKATQIGASGFLPYHDGGGYTDLIAIKGKATVHKVRQSVFKNCENDEESENILSDVERVREKEYDFGSQWKKLGCSHKFG